MDDVLVVVWESERGAAGTVLAWDGSVGPAVSLRPGCTAGEGAALVARARALAEGPCAVWAEHLGVRPEREACDAWAAGLSRMEPGAVIAREAWEQARDAALCAVLEAALLDLRVFGCEPSGG